MIERDSNGSADLFRVNLDGRIESVAVQAVGWVRDKDGFGRLGFAKQAAGELGRFCQRLQGVDDSGSFEGFLDDRVAARLTAFFFVERFEETGGEDDTDVTLFIFGLEPAAKVD